MPEMPRIVVRVPPEDLARWKEIAHKEGRDMSGLVRYAMGLYLESLERQAAHRTIGVASPRTGRKAAKERT